MLRQVSAGSCLAAQGSYLAAQGSYLAAQGLYLPAQGSSLVAQGSYLAAQCSHLAAQCSKIAQSLYYLNALPVPMLRQVYLDPIFSAQASHFVAFSRNTGFLD